ncbi:MAG TPA: CorA family divalent cation transporter, partial [Tissierellaceae bacterium]
MKINIILYNDTSYEEFLVDSLDEIETINISNKNIWIDIVGPYEEEDIIKLGNYYEINSLVLRDVLEEETISKYENFNEYLYIAFGITKLDIEEFKSLENVRINFILYKDKLITIRPDEYKVINDIKFM